VDGKLEILIADGMSEDGTSDILRYYAARFPQIRVFNNLHKTVPFALNLLVDKAQGDFVVLVGAHCMYPRSYVATLVRYLVKTGTDSVGGVVNAVPGSPSTEARAIASCLNSKFGVGFSFRTARGNTPVLTDTVAFGAWRSDHFKKYGRFDERFTRAQDLEHNLRVKKNGGHIVCLPWLKVMYYARSTFFDLAKMAYLYGYWKVPVRQKHNMHFSPRQYLSPSLVVATFFSVLFGWLISPVFLLLPLLYLVTNLIASTLTAHKDGCLRWFPLYMKAFGLLHFGHGIGYLRAAWEVYVKRKYDFRDTSEVAKGRASGRLRECLANAVRPKRLDYVVKRLQITKGPWNEWKKSHSEKTALSEDP
jgi:glycosyltransferase involved in cell wall biosynthesis